MALARKMIMAMHILLIFWIRAARAHDHDDNYGMKMKMKMKAVSVYYHDKYNVTTVLVAQPPSRAGAITPTESPFGALFATNVPITEGADPESARLGNLTMIVFACTPDYGSNYMVSMIFTFFENSSPHDHALHGLNGTLSVSAIISVSDPQPHPITGGTGSFAFATGSLTMVPIDISTFTQVVRGDLLLYWPPYAPTAPF